MRESCAFTVENTSRDAVFLDYLRVVGLQYHFRGMFWRTYSGFLDLRNLQSNLPRRPMRLVDGDIRFGLCAGV